MVREHSIQADQLRARGGDPRRQPSSGVSALGWLG